MGKNTQCAGAERNVLEDCRRTDGAQGQLRMFSSSSPRHKLKTIEQVRARNKSGVRTSNFTLRIYKRPVCSAEEEEKLT